ncbi:MAG: M48 family metallopeptidase [Gammaproteobacteria bacterium]|nr:M48 family metallopeptidase [Gammaproteobacteria bacterium]
MPTKAASPFTSLEREPLLPSIGDPADRHLSPNDERVLGAAFMRELYRQGNILDDPEIVEYIQHLGNTLVTHLDEPLFNFHFFVVNDVRINAFAVPGGYIGVNAGLIFNTRNESELAGVVGHEIAHVEQRHIARQIADAKSKSIPTLGAILAGMLLTMGGAGDAGAALIYAGMAGAQQNQINFTRIHEIEADRVGMQLLQRADYDPQGMANFFKVLQGKSTSRTPDYLEFLRTHPLDNDRIAEAEARIAQFPARKHVSSERYTLAKIRLTTLTSNEPTELLRRTAINHDASPLANYAYAQALERNRNFAAAADILKLLVKQFPENLPYVLALARVELAQNHAQQVQVLLYNVLQLYPDHYALVMLYAESLANSENVVATIAANDEMHSNTEPLNNKTPERQDKKNLSPVAPLPQAIHVLEQYLRKHPPLTPVFYRQLAELYNRNKQSILANQQMAEYYFWKGDYQAAIAQLRDALNDKPGIITRRQIEERLNAIVKMSRRDNS